jgi:hypothetical protein
MRTRRGNRSTRREPAAIPLCPPKVPYDLTQTRNQDAAVESRPELMARPSCRSWFLVYIMEKRNACSVAQFLASFLGNAVASVSSVRVPSQDN